MQLNKSHEQLLDMALENVDLDKIEGSMNEFLGRVVKKFIEEKIKDFPNLCLETRKINHLHNQEMERVGIRSKIISTSAGMTGGTTGWSQDGTMKHKWIIPTQLMFFMRNLIYREFWDDSNKKVRDSFMKAVLRGDDPLTLLEKVRKYYGTNAEKVKLETIHVGSDIS